MRLFGLKEDHDTRIGVVLLGGSRAILQTNQGVRQLLTGAFRSVVHAIRRKGQGPLAQSYTRLGVKAKGL